MLKLEVGKTYLDGYGDEVTIVSYDGGRSCPFLTDTADDYTDDGRFAPFPSRSDLVSEVVKSTPTVPTRIDGPKMTVRSLINGTMVIYLDKDCDPDLLITFAKGLKDE